MNWSAISVGIAVLIPLLGYFAFEIGNIRTLERRDTGQTTRLQIVESTILENTTRLRDVERTVSETKTELQDIRVSRDTLVREMLKTRSSVSKVSDRLARVEGRLHGQVPVGIEVRDGVFK